MLTLNDSSCKWGVRMLESVICSPLSCLCSENLLVGGMLFGVSGLSWLVLVKERQTRLGCNQPDRKWVIIIIIIEGLSLLQSIPPTTADKQTQAQKRRGSRSRKWVAFYNCGSSLWHQCHPPPCLRASYLLYPTHTYYVLPPTKPVCSNYLIVNLSSSPSKGVQSYMVNPIPPAVKDRGPRRD